MKWVDLSAYKPASGGPLDAVQIANGLSAIQNALNDVTIAGADLASAATINITSPFHGITGVATIDNIADANSPTAGELVQLWIKAGPLTIRNNGGGTGNIRSLTGADISAPANAIITFVFDGTVWRQQGLGSSAGPVAHASKTSNVSTTAITFGTGASVLASALSFTADGTSDYRVSIFASYWFNDTAGKEVLLHLKFDGADFGQWGVLDTINVNTGVPLAAAYLVPAPAAGAHTVNGVLYCNGGTCAINAGAGGGNTPSPVFIIVEKLL